LALALVAVPIVGNRRTQIAGDVLNQGAGQEDVQTLNPEAYCQERLLLGEAVPQEREIGALAGKVRIGAFGPSRGAKSRRIYISGASGQQHGVKGCRELLELFRGQAQ